MHYTSGTTGKPKGVKRGRVDMDPDDLFSLYSLFLTLFGVQPHDGNVHITGSPLYHTAVLLWTSNSLHLGHKVVLMDKWDAEEMLRLIDEHRVTTSHMVPTQLHRLLALPEEVRAKYDCTSTRCMVHAAAPCPPEVKRRMIEWWGDAVMEYYAATEGGGTIVTAKEWLERPGTVGKAWSGAEVRIYDDEGKQLGPGEVGTDLHGARPGDLRVQGRREEDQGQPPPRRGHRGRFFTVGDVGEIDEEGYLFLRDRKIDMIISGGVNIYPAEIEGEFLTHPKVGDVAVFGVPHPDWGEAVMAVVEPAEGVEAGDRARGGAPRLRQGAPGVLQAPGDHRVHRRDAPRPQRQALQAQAPRPALGRDRPPDLISRTGRGGGGRRPRARRRPGRCRTSG